MRAINQLCLPRLLGNHSSFEMALTQKKIPNTSNNKFMKFSQVSSAISKRTGDLIYLLMKNDSCQICLEFFFVTMPPQDSCELYIIHM